MSLWINYKVRLAKQTQTTSTFYWSRNEAGIRRSPNHQMNNPKISKPKLTKTIFKRVTLVVLNLCLIQNQWKSALIIVIPWQWANESLQTLTLSACSFNQPLQIKIRHRYCARLSAWILEQIRPKKTKFNSNRNKQNWTLQTCCRSTRAQFLCILS